jgi:hypothetical protein
VLVALHGTAKVDFVADAYLGKPGGLPVNAGPPTATVAARGAAGLRPSRITARVPRDADGMLEYLAYYFGREWVREDGIVRFRSPDWAEDLLADPPAPVVARLRSRLEENERLDLSDLAWASYALTDRQAFRLTNIHDLTPPPGSWLPLVNHPDLEALRLYGSLSPEQQWSVFHGGLRARAMNQEQIGLLEACINEALTREWLLTLHRRITVDEVMDTLLSARTGVVPRYGPSVPGGDSVTFTFRLVSTEADFEVPVLLPRAKKLE